MRPKDRYVIFYTSGDKLMLHVRELDGPVDRTAAAAHLVSLLEGLSPYAQRNGLHVVAYLLDMAHLEASAIAMQTSPR